MKVAIIILTVNQRDMTLQCLSSLLCPFTEDDRVGQTQAKLRFMHDRGVINDGGGAQINFLLWQINPVGYGQIDGRQFDTAKKCICCGGAMMVRTDVFLQLDWFLFMRRHASLRHQFGFFLLGAPYLALRIMIREGRRGNIEALRGLAGSA